MVAVVVASVLALDKLWKSMVCLSSVRKTDE